MCPRITLLSPSQQCERSSTSDVLPPAAAPSCCAPSSAAAPSARSAPRSAVPAEVEIAVALDAAELAALAPLLDGIAEAPPQAAPCFVPAESRPPRPHIAELFRRAYEARDARLAPKRAKNARQRQRREQHAAESALESWRQRAGPRHADVLLSSLRVSDTA